MGSAAMVPTVPGALGLNPLPKPNASIWIGLLNEGLTSDLASVVGFSIVIKPYYSHYFIGLITSIISVINRCGYYVANIE
jgi:hypothetical protein